MPQAISTTTIRELLLGVRSSARLVEWAGTIRPCGETALHEPHATGEIYSVVRREYDIFCTGGWSPPVDGRWADDPRGGATRRWSGNYSYTRATNATFVVLDFCNRPLAGERLQEARRRGGVEHCLGSVTSPPRFDTVAAAEAAIADGRWRDGATCTSCREPAGPLTGSRRGPIVEQWP